MALRKYMQREESKHSWHYQCQALDTRDTGCLGCVIDLILEQKQVNVF